MMENEMPRANRYGPGIIKQRGTFYATRQVPKRLQDRVGRKRLVKTLQTDSLSEARRRAPIVLAEFDALLDEPKESLDVQWFRRMAETMTNGNRELILDILDTEINERYGPTEVEQTPEDRAESERIIEAVLSPLTESYIDDYLQTKQTQELRPITIRRMRTELAMLANRFPYVHQIAKKDVAEWVDELMSTLSSNTVRKYASTWRQYYGYLMRRDIVDEGSNPFAVTVRDNRKRSRVVRQAFTATQIKTLLHESARDSILHDFILFAAYTGCRVGEIGSLRIEDLNGDAVTIHDAKTKAGNRTVPLSHQLLPMVLRRIGNRSSQTWKPVPVPQLNAFPYSRTA
jgi:integrase